MAPSTMPSSGLPPNRLTADHPIRTGRKTKDVFAIRLMMLATSVRPVYRSTTASPSKKMSGAVSRLLMPISRPAVTSAGSSGTKMSAKILMSCSPRPSFSAPAAFTSSLVALPTSATSMISAYTLSTVPAPMITWNCPPAANEPLTRSTASRAAASTRLSSARAKRSRVMQWVAATMLPAPPIAATICSAASVSCFMVSSLVEPGVHCGPWAAPGSAVPEIHRAAGGQAWCRVRPSTTASSPASPRTSPGRRRGARPRSRRSSPRCRRAAAPRRRRCRG
jgi:hypothetical protein